MFQTRGIRPRLMHLKKNEEENHHKDFQESCILLYTRGIRPWLIFPKKSHHHFQKKKSHQDFQKSCIHFKLGAFSSTSCK